MSNFDYKVVAAPQSAGKHKGLKGVDAFARTLEEVLTREAVDGWEFQRTETLPCEERAGMLGGREAMLRAVLVFRRERETARRTEPAGPKLVADNDASVFAEDPAPSPRPVGPAER